MTNGRRFRRPRRRDRGTRLNLVKQSPPRDATQFWRLVAASKALRLAEVELREAVAAARDAADSRTLIGAVLGTTQEAAEGRFAQVPERNSETWTDVTREASEERPVLWVQVGPNLLDRVPSTESAT
jgi:hypothetical protein